MINNHKSVRWRRIFSCNLLFIILTLPLTAQDILVTGKVIDAHLPISGANVLIINTTNGVVTDFDGRYRITAKPTDTLQISYLGYTTLTIPILNRSMINVTLQEDATTLGEVQINAGYYTTTDREKTGSIARITAKDIQGQPVNNPLEALIGRLTGVDVVPTSGVPGSGFEVKIRGQNSIMGGNAPLYIIDGVPFDSQSLGASNSSLTIIPSGNISPLNAINPATIESIEVLKDADATAIYGSRGANGVVLITTKKGKQGDTKFTINSSAGIANITLKSDLLNTAQYIEMRREAFANDGIATYPYDAYDVNGTWDQTRDTDWQEILIGGTAITRKLEASVSGGSERTQVLLSGMHQNETTVFPGDFNYDRISINSNLNHHSINKRFEMVFNSAYTIEDNHLPSSDLTSNALWLAPNAPQLYDDAGSLNWANNTWTNPLAQLEGTYTSSANTLIANAVLNYHVLDNLTLKLNTGYSNTVLEDQRHIPHTIYNPAFGLQSRISQSYSHQAQRNTFIAEPQLSWSFSNAQHSWQLLLGTTFQNRKEERLTLLGVGFSDNSFLGTLSAANNLRILNENQLEYKYQSLFGRINYAFKKKLFLNVTARRDGSSRFSTGNRYGNFGAVGAAWFFSEDLKLPWLSFGKIRGSYGINVPLSCLHPAFILLLCQDTIFNSYIYECEAFNHQGFQFLRSSWCGAFPAAWPDYFYAP
ncbi:SusC/RagA family TonB-linked outer membrane protein [Gelidibacter sp.]|uniref:SusC/RagA family TonB-linked outer membrane protein n=1 Tax=Gelidibacter sp. TaxID=2018083 RepID=UPI0032656B7B